MMPDTLDGPAVSDLEVPDRWLEGLLGTQALGESTRHCLSGEEYAVVDGILRLASLVSETQKQTEEAFGYKWKRRDTYESDAWLRRAKAWLLERYGDVEHAPWWSEYSDQPVVVDAGCGAAVSAIELFGERLRRVRYLGVDVSDAVDVARTRLRERGIDAAFLQADLSRLPLPDGSADVVFSEGVLHHTDSTQKALHAVARLLRVGGRLLFYVYRRKGPIREYTDDYVRGRLQSMSPEQAWEALTPLTQLGIELGRLNAKINIPQDIDLLEIPRGEFDLQRFFYWHVAKVFYRPELTLEELNHITFDWYYPANAHRQSVEEVRAWCADNNLLIEREVVEEAGITIIARKV